MKKQNMLKEHVQYKRKRMPLNSAKEIKIQSFKILHEILLNGIEH